MLSLFLAPACVFALPTPPGAIDRLMEALEGVPECVVEGHAIRIPQEARRAVRAWRTHRAALGRRLTVGEVAQVEARMDTVQAAGSDAAEAALDVQDVLARQMAEGRPRQLLDADRACMRAWLRAEAGHWDALPDLDNVFTPLLAPGQAHHAPVQAQVRTALDRQRSAKTARDAAGFKAAVRTLLELVDALEK